MLRQMTLGVGVGGGDRLVLVPRSYRHGKANVTDHVIVHHITVCLEMVVCLEMEDPRKVIALSLVELASLLS